MALNPVLTPAGEVWRLPGEYLILRRPRCEFEVNLGAQGILKGTGPVLLSP